MHFMNLPRIAGTIAVTAVASTAFVPPPAVGAGGGPDPSFGTDGVSVVDAGGLEVANAIARQSDGKIVVGGRTTGGASPDGLVYRLNPDGTRDQAFGLRRLAVPGTSVEVVNRIAVQADGRIVAAGRTGKGDDAVVWRLLPTGEPDPEFGGGDGIATFDNGGTEYFTDVAIAPNGAIVAVGYTSLGNGLAAIYRLKPDGTPDPTFDDDGKIGVGSSGGGSVAVGVAVQPDGRVLVAGHFGDVDDYGLRVRRFLVDGDPDGSFGEGDGEAMAFGLNDGGVSDLALQPDGRIVVSGTHSNGSLQGFSAVRYTSAGRVDRSFGGTADHDGVIVPTGSQSLSRAVDVQPSGAVVVAGGRLVDGLVRAAVVALDPAGVPDPAFGSDGQVTLPDGVVVAFDSVIQPDGRVVLASSTTGTPGTADAAVVRLSAAAPEQPAAICQGKPATIVGTAGRDRISGTRKADVIVARGGRDVVKARGGNDVVCVGGGADQVTGGDGMDRLYGGRGRDVLVGGAGKDRLVGGPGRDRTSQRS